MQGLRLFLAAVMPAFASEIPATCLRNYIHTDCNLTMWHVLLNGEICLFKFLHSLWLVCACKHDGVWKPYHMSALGKSSVGTISIKVKKLRTWKPLAAMQFIHVMHHSFKKNIIVASEHNPAQMWKEFSYTAMQFQDDRLHLRQNQKAGM